MADKKVNFKFIEKKWQREWAKAGAFEASDNGKKKKFYSLQMFPYPSADYLHMGHVRNYAMGDLVSRYKRMKGFNVLSPMGFDAFGLPAENAAIKDGTHPKKYTENAISVITKLMKDLGLSYDWNRVISTHEPEYYKWNQWLFLRMLEKGIVYRAKAPVNFCHHCNTVLANEEVEDGKCWRCGNVVSVKNLEQWFVKTTAYAEELLNDLEKVNFPVRVREAQKNWIGRSEGAKILFSVKDMSDTLEVFTTRADTLFGVTFVACAAKHEIVEKLVSGTKYEKKYLEFLSGLTASEKLGVEQEKKGFFTGRYAVHPLTGEQIPIYAVNFVVADYGTGAVMGVPAHDNRDWDFAKKHKIPVKSVIDFGKKIKGAFVGDGKLINSGHFSGLQNNDARQRIIETLNSKGVGGKTVQYKLRDWLISRQRYWGTPIPIIYCDNCGVVPVPEKDLPVLLPEKVKFTGKGNPLLNSKEFVEAKCPSCKSVGRRETDTMSTFMDSSWYYLRFCSPKSHDVFDRKSVGYWMPVDQYIGGIEHATGHLMYSRFMTKFLRDSGWLVIDEPFSRLFNQGIVHKDGVRMSKSNGNGVTAEEVSEKYGIDTARLFLMFVASPEKDIDWDEHGIEGMYRVVMSLFRLLDKVGGSASELMEHKLNKTLKELESSYDKFEFNKGLVTFIELVNYLDQQTQVPRFVLERVALMIAPVMPHVAEEIWSKIGRSTLIATEDWPHVEEAKINDELEMAEKNVDKTVSDILNVLGIVKKAEKVYLYVIPKDLEMFDEKVLSLRVGKKVRVYAVNDSAKYDPTGKASKAKLGRPAVYVE